MLDFSELSLPFQVKDLISSGNSLIGLVGGFILLALAFVFVPMLIEIIKVSILTHQDNKINAGSPKHQRKYSESIYTNVFEDRIYSIKKKIVNKSFKAYFFIAI